MKLSGFFHHTLLHDTTLAHYLHTNSCYIVLFIFLVLVIVSLHTHDTYSLCIIIQLIQIYHGYRWTITYIKNYCTPVKQCSIPLELFKPYTIIEERLFIQSQ